MVTWGSAFFIGKETVIELVVGGDGWDLIPMALDAVNDGKKPSEIFLSLFNEVRGYWNRGAIKVFSKTAEVIASLGNEWTFILDPKWGSIEASIPNDYDMDALENLNYFIIPIGSTMIWHSITTRKIDTIAKLYECWFADLTQSDLQSIKQFAKDLDVSCSFKPSLDQLLPNFFDRMNDFLEESSNVLPEVVDAALDKIMALYQQTSEVDRLASKGFSFLNIDRHDLAKQCFKQVQEQDPLNLTVLMGTGIMAREERNEEVLKKTLETLQEHCSESAELTATTCGIAKRDETLNEKTAGFEKKVAELGTTNRYWRDLALHYYYLDDEVQFLRAGTAYVLSTEGSYSKLLLSFMTNTATKRKKHAWGLNFALKALELEPSANAEIGMALASIADQIRILSSDKTGKEGEEEKKVDERKRKRELKAWKNLLKKLADYFTGVFPEDGRTWASLAVHYLATGDRKNTEICIEKGLSAKVPIPALYFLKTKYLMAGKADLDAIIRLQEKGLAMDPENAEEWFSLVVYLTGREWAKEKPEKAIELIKKTAKALRNASHYFKQDNDFAQWVPQIEEDLSRMHPKLKLMWFEFKFMKTAGWFEHIDGFEEDLREIVSGKVTLSGIWGFMMAGMGDFLKQWHEAVVGIKEELAARQ